MHTGLNYNHLFDSAFFNAEFGFKLPLPKVISYAITKFEEIQNKLKPIGLQQLLMAFKPVGNQAYKQRFLVKLGSINSLLIWFLCFYFWFV